MPVFSGTSRSEQVEAHRRRKDTRSALRKLSDLLDTGDGVVLGLFVLPIAALLLLWMPGSGEALLLAAWLYRRRVVDPAGRGFDFPFRVPLHAHVGDASLQRRADPKTGSLAWRPGTGITYLAQDMETKEQVYSGDSDMRTHMLVLGTTGSGKTEFLLGLITNALVQNTGFIMVDGKGDPKTWKEVFRLMRRFGREDDLLLVNFITSGRDFLERQTDKATNNLNLMSNTSSGMLIELIVALMDDSGGGGDMWKGRAISFVAALTRPLVYMRDKGFINLSPERFLEFFELSVLEALVWKHDNKYGELFDVVLAPLQTYLLTLPGYKRENGKSGKPQDGKTLEQHGFIVMQLTRIFNDLSFNYGHIFKTRVGDVDFFDVVLNRRGLMVLLPALERAPDSLRMLGKLVVGNIKQIMAGCLGNRVEGLVREIIDSRPTNAPVPFYTILDEYGYYAVVGFAVAPAQARSLGFAMTFAAQDFSSLKKSSPEEADATWENTNVRAVGRLTSGEESETWKRVSGAAGQTTEAVIAGYERRMGAAAETIRASDNVSIEKRNRLDYNDQAMFADGEFTFIVGKKERGGASGGVRVVRGMGFYTAGPSPKDVRLNDFLPVEPPEPADMPTAKRVREALLAALENATLAELVGRVRRDPVLELLGAAFAANYPAQAHARPKLPRRDAVFGVLGHYLAGTLAAAAGEQDTQGEALRRRASATVPQGAEGVTAAAAQGPSALGQVGGDWSPAEIAVLSAANRLLAQHGAALPAAPDLAGSGLCVGDDAPVGPAESEAFDAVAGPMLAAALAASAPPGEDFEPILPGDHKDEDGEDGEDGAGAALQRSLLEAQLVATGFSSMSEKFAAEQRLADLVHGMNEHHGYPPQPAPPPANQATVEESLRALADVCRADVRQSQIDLYG